MDADANLTLDQAADIALADDSSVNTVPVVQRDDNHDLPYEPERPLHDRSLTLDQAAALLGDDDEGDSGSQIGPHSVAAMIDGKALTMSELVQGYVGFQRVRDSIARIEQEYEAVQDAADGVVSSAWELSRFMVAQMPHEPDMALLHYNPTEYVQQKAMHDQALGSVQHVLGQAHQARASAFALQERYHNMNLQTEKARLVQHIPEVADDNQRQQFFQRMLDVAYACGFTAAEFEQVVDHRIFRLGALALKGMEAIAEAPQPKERRRHRRKRYSNAMEKLTQTGSIEDALAVDFE